MKTLIFDKLPPDAVSIREEVFVCEQGFTLEFDKTDDFATHYVLYDGDSPVAVCRSFYDKSLHAYVVGRIAVVKSHRKKGLGRKILCDVEDDLRKKGAACIILHAQVSAVGFYKSCGYESFGDIDTGEGCPHIWMKKEIRKQ